MHNFFAARKHLVKQCNVIFSQAMPGDLKRKNSQTAAPFWPQRDVIGSALVNIRRKALLSSVWFRKGMTSCSPRVSHVSFASIVYSDLSDDLMFVSRSCLAFSTIPRLIQPRRCYCTGKDVLMFRLDQAS